MTLYKELYFALLPLPLVTSSVCGMVNGFNYGCDKKCNNFKAFSGMIGLSSIGIITGILYPISFPILAGYMFIKKDE